MYKNATVADPIAKYTILDYGFELIDAMYMLNGLAVCKFLKAHKMTAVQSWNIKTMNVLKRNMKLQTMKEEKMEIVIVMMVMMIRMIKTDGHHAPPVTVT